MKSCERVEHKEGDPRRGPGGRHVPASVPGGRSELARGADLDRPRHRRASRGARAGAAPDRAARGQLLPRRDDREGLRERGGVRARALRGAGPRRRVRRRERAPGERRSCAGARAVKQALAAAGRPGEIPSLLYIGGAPGKEEAVLAGIESVVGKAVPIVGGSSADNTVEGHWKQFTSEEVFGDAIVVSGLFPSTSTASAFQSGYTRRASPARSRAPRGGGSTPSTGGPRPWSTTSGSGGHPGGARARREHPPADHAAPPRETGGAGGLGMFAFRLAHPDSVTPGRALTLFADAHEGNELILMRGTVEGLVKRAPDVARRWWGCWGSRRRTSPGRWWSSAPGAC